MITGRMCGNGGRYNSGMTGPIRRLTLEDLYAFLGHPEPIVWVVSEWDHSLYGDDPPFLHVKKPAAFITESITEERPRACADAR